MAEERVSIPQRIAEKIAGAIGVKFLLFQTIVIILWIWFNMHMMTDRFDPYPFILMNLALSLQAAYTGPVLLIASKRHERLANQLAEETHQHVLETHSIIEKEHKKHLALLHEHHERHLDKVRNHHREHLQKVKAIIKDKNGE